MKLGLGLYRHMLTKAHFDFARQCGCTHVVVHLVDYFYKSSQEGKDNQPIGGMGGWGEAGHSKELWEVEALLDLKRQIQAAGLELAAIENFDPADWYDILLDGPNKQLQIEEVKRLIRNVGAAGIPVIGYNFSLAGVCSRISGNFARGNAVSVGMEGVDERPIPVGTVWNMIYDPNAEENFVKEISHEVLWQRLAYFLQEVIPVAEAAGVCLAAHPDDPPMPVVRRTPRLVYQPEMYQRLLDLQPSKSNALEFCLGSIAEMTAGDIYEATDLYADKIAYVHCRNVQGKVPHYKEVFIDEGDIDMVRILRMLKDRDFKGVIIPDHTPQMSCDGAWYAGMAYTLGYLKGVLSLI